MQLDYDDTRWPELGDFRRACLNDDFSRLKQIADKGHDWYPSENPEGKTLAHLAQTFQWQYHASLANYDALEALAANTEWGATEPWTLQGWLPITQATASPGDGFDALRLLLRLGADARQLAGDPDDRANAVDMARYAGNEGLAAWLEHESSSEAPGTTLVIQKSREFTAGAENVFAALTTSSAIVECFPYDSVESSWQQGAEITLRGTADGEPFTDYGTIEVLKPATAFQYAYWSANHGTERTAANHLRIRYDIKPTEAGCTLSVTHFDIRSETYRAMMLGAWDMLLDALAGYVAGS